MFQADGKTVGAGEPPNRDRLANGADFSDSADFAGWPALITSTRAVTRGMAAGQFDSETTNTLIRPVLPEATIAPVRFALPRFGRRCYIPPAFRGLQA